MLDYETFAKVFAVFAQIYTVKVIGRFSWNIIVRWANSRKNVPLPYHRERVVEILDSDDPDVQARVAAAKQIPASTRPAGPQDAA